MESRVVVERLTQDGACGLLKCTEGNLLWTLEKSKFNLTVAFVYGDWEGWSEFSRQSISSLSDTIVVVVMREILRNRSLTK